MSTIPPETMRIIAPRLQQAPVDILAVAADLGLAIYTAELAAGVSGVLTRAPEYGTRSGFVIFVNQNEVHVRQRFTAAHECGHYVLHRDKIGVSVEDNYMLRAVGFSSAVEAQANKFAADVLMPYPLIQRLMDEGITAVDELANRLGVSQVAMSIRLDLPT